MTSAFRTTRVVMGRELASYFSTPVAAIFSAGFPGAVCRHGVFSGWLL